MTKVAILGAGPIGMEAALYGAVAGYDVQVFERGRIGENLRRWGYVNLFTEWKRDRSPLAQQLLEARGDTLPDAETCPTGNEVADYLLRLAILEPLRGRISPQTEVVSISREGALKSDYWHDPRRASRQFRLLTKGVAGEKIRHFDVVIDATGVYSAPNHAGNGGMLAPGEKSLAPFIDYAIPDILGRDRDRFINQHALIIGSGHSAASTLLAVADLFERGSRTKITWVVRRGLASDGSVYWIDPNDFVSSRRRLGERANALVKDPRVDFHPRTLVESIERRHHQFKVVLSDGTLVDCDTICAHTGFRADTRLWEELQVVTHPATGGPSQLSEVLMEENKRTGVGLSTGYAEKLSGDGPKPEIDPRVASPELLRLPEPNFYVLGIKSYGRDAGFLMQNGFRQVRDVYRLISGNMELDLYEGAL